MASENLNSVFGLSDPMLPGLNCDGGHNRVLNEFFINFYENVESKSSERFDLLLRWKSKKGIDKFKSDKRLQEQIFNMAYNRIKLDSTVVYSTYEEMRNFVFSSIPNLTPKEQQNRVLSYVYELLPFLGGGCAINMDAESEYIKGQHWRKFYFIHTEEFVFYLDNLKSSSYLDFKVSDSGYHGIKLTVEGLERIIQFQEVKNSPHCFVAMSFDDELRIVYTEAIKPAIEATGFLPLIVSDVEKIQSETTINDTIIASIKKARFTIADFTQHKKGVYFEAGYALGRGQHVIYTCKTDEIRDAHFDTRNYKHLTWDTPEELKRKLVDHIRANIDGAKLE